MPFSRDRALTVADEFIRPRYLHLYEVCALVAAPVSNHQPPSGFRPNPLSPGDPVTRFDRRFLSLCQASLCFFDSWNLRRPSAVFSLVCYVDAYTTSWTALSDLAMLLMLLNLFTMDDIPVYTAETCLLCFRATSVVRGRFVCYYSDNE